MGAIEGNALPEARFRFRPSAEGAQVVPAVKVRRAPLRIQRDRAPVAVIRFREAAARFQHHAEVVPCGFIFRLRRHRLAQHLLRGRRVVELKVDDAEFFERLRMIRRRRENAAKQHRRLAQPARSHLKSG